MAPSILVFDFGADETSAQQARHKVDAWKQGFRLGNKMLLKFERHELADDGEAGPPKSEAKAEEQKPAKPKSVTHSGKRAKGEKAEEKEEEEKSSARIRVLLRLDFSDHEKLSQQRWLDRIPAEEPFKSAKGETIRAADAGFEKIAAEFESLD